MNALDAALVYAARGWPVFAITTGKRPLTGHGLLDATRDPETIRAWYRRWPDALFAIATGEPSGMIALDIDVRPGSNGFDSLENDLGISVHPETPTAHTPSGGCHLLFRWPGHFVKTIAGKLGVGLDVRRDGGSLILPPGPGRYWDPHLGPDTPLVDMPEWMVIAEPERAPIGEPIKPTTGLSPYGEAALDSACRAILAAPVGKQEATLNSECFAIGTLAGTGAIPSPFARRALIWAARQIPSYNPRRPWRVADLDHKVERAFADGLRHPREALRA
jgi:putative DNA primase/helicase